MKNNKTDKYYFLSPENEVVGPFSFSDFKKLNLGSDTKVMRDKDNKWILYNDVIIRKKKNYRKKIYTGVIGVIILIVISCFFIFRDRTHRLLANNSYECEELNMYLEKYYRDIEFFGISTVKSRTVVLRMAPMQYFESTKDYHGVSFGYGDDDLIEIYINEDSWKQFSKPQKYWLMYHELSHDILNVDDESKESADFSHLMCPFIDTFNKVSMDEFIEASHDLFMNYSNNI